MVVVSPMSPYRDTAILYRKAGWLGTLPLPYKKKMSPPEGFTGHRAAYPTVEEIKGWRNSGKRQNICIRLAGVDDDTEIIGIDVDHYASGDKNKRGGDQLSALEERYGDLPDTWISGARTDGRSGIRYFRVPRGMAFRGKADKDIDCISKGYRYAAVWPSVHPESGVYWWFPPGVAPDAEGKKAWNGDLPDARKLPLLPEKWLDFLTAGKMRSEADDRIDMESTVSEIDTWADDTFHGDSDTEMCSLLAKKVELHKKKIAEDATSHDKALNAHYNIIRLAAEGHVGWVKAINEVEAFWAEDVLKRGKRSMREVHSEIWRSRMNALRKVKAQCDERIKIGASAVDMRCDLSGVCGSAQAGPGDTPPPSDPLDDIPRGALGPVDEYDTNDLGNAMHLRDMFAPVSGGSSIRWVEGVGWLIWHDGENAHWQRDETGNEVMHQLWEKVYKRQKDYIENALTPAFEVELANAIAAGLPPTGQNAPVSLVAARNKLSKWTKFVETNGNQNKIEACLKKLKALAGIPLDIKELDNNPRLLGVANGVLELSVDEVVLRPAKASDFVTLNTNVAYEAPQDTYRRIWEEYLETFVPNMENRKALQVAAGYCLLGRNPHRKIIVLKGDTKTGKSTFVEAITAALGDYGSPVTQSFFQNHKLNPILARALDRRVVGCSEFDANEDISVSVIKRLTGEDTIPIEFKGSNVIREGRAQATMVIATNDVPKIQGSDKALEDRLLVFPFDSQVVRADGTKKDVIETSGRQAVLNWMVEGYIEYCRIGNLIITQDSERARDEFMSELDEISMFMSMCVERHSGYKTHGGKIDWKQEPDWCVSRAALRKHFELWWVENGFQANKLPSAIAMTKRLRALGWLGTKGNAVERVAGKSEVNRWWYGIRLKKLRKVAVSNVTSFPMKTEVKVLQTKSDTESDT